MTPAATRIRCCKNYLGVVHGNNWGDWLNQNEPTPLDYVDTVYFAYSSRLMSEMAAAIGKDTEATEYRQLLDNIKTAYQQKYLKPDGSLTVDTQTAYAMALFFDLVPERLRPAVGQKLVGKIRDNGTRMATGFLGSRPLLPALSSVGQHDLATVLFQSRKFPSWGYEVEQGATTIWERWDSFTKEDGFGRHNAAMNSFSHYAFGAVCDWMFGQLAGIDTGEPGFQRIVIQPSPPPSDSNPAQEPIHWVKSSYDSIRGPITSHWKRGQNTFTLDTRIPANTTATVYLPARDAASVAEGGQPLQKTEGVRFLRMENNRAVLAIESGSYHFTSQF